MQLIDLEFKKELISLFKKQPRIIKKQYKNYLDFLDQQTNCSESGLKKIQNLKTDCYLIYSDYYSLLNFLNKFKIEKLPKPTPKKNILKKHKIKVFYSNTSINILVKIKKPPDPIKTTKKLTISEIIKKYNLKV